MRRFCQVDVFTTEPWLGNPVAVVHDAAGISDEKMAAFARWTNLSETTFLLPPTHADADYRLRIWTPGGELPFAGHPTIGSAHAWLEAGGVSHTQGTIIQECGAGLVTLRDHGGRLAFAAPPLVRSGPVDDDTLATVMRCLGVGPDRVVAAEWVDNGPGWLGLLLDSADTVLALRPDVPGLGDLEVGVIGPYAAADVARVGAAYEVRAICPSLGIGEDPVTGSLNAGLAQWLIGSGRAPTAYVASQGTVLGRRGRVRVEAVGGDVWVAGDAVTCVTGQVAL